MTHLFRRLRASASVLLICSAAISTGFLLVQGCNSTPPPDTVNRVDSSGATTTSQSRDTLARFLAAMMSDSIAEEGTEEQQCRWTYPEMTGTTNNWVKAGCTSCGPGQRFTSPIALNPATAEPLDGVLPYDLIPSSLSVNLRRFEHDNTYAFKVGQPLTISSTLGNGLIVTWKLEEFHFHTAAEHPITGYPAAMEMHVKATAQSGGSGAAVFAVRFDSTNANSTLLQGVARAVAGQPDQRFDITTALAPFLTDVSYFYIGSLTTPPCTGPAIFYVLESPIGVDPASLKGISATLIALTNGWPNVRPVQRYTGSVYRLVPDVASL